MDIKIRKLVFASLFTAITCVATMIIQIPTPIGGYVTREMHLSYLIHAARGVWADSRRPRLRAFRYYLRLYCLCTGTFVIKFIMSVTASAIFKTLPTKNIFKVFIAAVIAEICMVVLYFIYESIILGFGMAAVAEIIPNSTQGLFGAVVGSALVLALLSSDYVVKSFPELRK